MAGPKVKLVRRYATKHPDESYAEIVAATGTSPATVSRALSKWESDEARERRELAGRGYRDLIGRRFGHLTVLRYDKGDGLLCRCDCGRELHIDASRLRRDMVNRCGRCSTVKPGDTFGALTTVRRVGDGNGGGRLSMRWLCRCECGRECVRYESALVSGDKTSCGCRSEQRRRQAATSGRVDGTKLSSLTASRSKANSTGAKGVSHDETSGLYVARIKLRGISYSLGRYRSLADAAEARRIAEKVMFDPILEEHGREPTSPEEYRAMLDEVLGRREDGR